MDRQPSPSRAPTPFIVMVTVILLIALLSGGAAFTLTVAAPPEHPEQYTAQAASFFDIAKMCVVALLGLVAGAKVA